MDRPHRCTRRLIVFTGEAEEDLFTVTRRLCLNNSMAVREALHFAELHLAEHSSPLPVKGQEVLASEPQGEEIEASS